MRSSHWKRNLLGIGVLLVPLNAIIVVFSISLVLGLPDTAKLTEVLKIATLLLTIEGILVGLSPLVFQRFGGTLGPVFVTVAAFALLWSLLTIITGDTLPSLQILGTIYLIDLLFFEAVIDLLVLFAWREHIW